MAELIFFFFRKQILIYFKNNKNRFVGFSCWFILTHTSPSPCCSSLLYRGDQQNLPLLCHGDRQHHHRTRLCLLPNPQSHHRNTHNTLCIHCIPLFIISQSFIPTLAHEILYGTCELLHDLPAAVILDEEARGGDTLRGTEETDLIEELDTTGLESDKEVRVDLGVDERATDLRADDETILLDAKDVNGFF